METKSKKQNQSNDIGQIPGVSDIIANKIRKFPRKDLESIFSELSSVAYEVDQEKMSSILDQVKEGNQLDNEQSVYLNNYYVDNFYSLLPAIPKEDFNCWIIPFAIGFVLLGITMRVATNRSTEGFDMLVIAGLNVIALVLTVFTAYSSLYKTVTEWVMESKILEEDKKCLLGKFSKERRIVLFVCWVIIVAVIIYELIMGYKGILGLGNDITAIIALGFAISSEKIVNMCIRFFEVRLKENAQ